QEINELWGGPLEDDIVRQSVLERQTVSCERSEQLQVEYRRVLEHGARPLMRKADGISSVLKHEAVHVGQPSFGKSQVVEPVGGECLVKLKRGRSIGLIHETHDTAVHEACL